MVAQAQVALFHPARLWNKYNRALKTSPLVTKSVTCMAAYALGDGIAQVATSPAPTIQKRILSLDVVRMARLALFGLLWTGPSGHAFYRWLDKAFHSMACGRVASIAGKVGVDQLCYSPLCTMVFFTWVNAACFTPEKITTDISQKLLSSTRASWQLWAPAMIFNMALVPAQLRMLFINVISLFWTYKLSTMSAAKSPADECDADIMRLTQVEQAPAASAASVEDILAHVPGEDFAELVLTVNEGADIAFTSPQQDGHPTGMLEDVNVALA